MKNTCAIILVAALLGTVGCASSSRVARLPGVGPGAATAESSDTEGYLRVYSAREQVPINVNGEEFYWNSDYGRNDFLYGAAHTAYTLLHHDGQLLMRVPNATGMNDAKPTLVNLAPGDYLVKAEAADYDGVDTTVTVPVCVVAGQTTVLHLDGQWSAGVTGAGNDLVRLANGSAVGWHCSSSETMPLALQARN
jgi:hypothetical protein